MKFSLCRFFCIWFGFCCVCHLRKAEKKTCSQFVINCLSLKMCHPATCFNLVPVLMQLASYLNMTASKQSMAFTLPTPFCKQIAKRLTKVPCLYLHLNNEAILACTCSVFGCTGTQASLHRNPAS